MVISCLGLDEVKILDVVFSSLGKVRSAGEVAVFRTKHWDCSNTSKLNEYEIPFHEAHMTKWDSSPACLAGYNFRKTPAEKQLIWLFSYNFTAEEA